MNNFNLLVSAPRYHEEDVKSEIWFTMLMCGDKYPIISDLQFQGLITVFSTLECKEIIRKMKEILEKDPNFFQYVLKVVPIDFVCKTDIEIINEIVKNNYNEFISEEDSFRIKLNRRNNELIERDSFIDKIASNFKNEVDLENPDKIVRFEILGNVSGISFLESEQLIRVKKEFFKT
ncbi:MAG: tRNA sulfurtransferase [Promethearchaeota archaeon]|nr:MAG: tRNA sulfurtransferase [Candidatus Lokiarchaeota archaeon]